MGNIKQLLDSIIPLRQEQIVLESGKVITCYMRDITVTALLQRTRETEGQPRHDETFSPNAEPPLGTKLFKSFDVNLGEI